MPNSSRQPVQTLSASTTPIPANSSPVAFDLDTLVPTRLSGSTWVQITSGSVVSSSVTSGSAYFDTQLPRLVWNAADTILVVPSKLSNETGNYLTKTIRMTFQDGIQRSYSGSTLQITSSVSGIGGIDSGTFLDPGEKTDPEWFYIYAVPSGTNSIGVIASRNHPTGSTTWGPVGYSNFRYLGPVYWRQVNTTSSFAPRGFTPFYQNDEKSFSFLQQQTLYTSASLLKTGIPLLSITAPNVSEPSLYHTPLPPTVSKVYFRFRALISGSGEYVAFAVSPFGTSSYVDMHFTSATIYPQNFEYMIGYPTENSLMTLGMGDVTTGSVSVSTINIYWYQFEDGWLGGTIPPSTLSMSLGGISGSARSSRVFLASQRTSVATSDSPEECGTLWFVPSEHNTTRYELRAIVSAGSASQSVVVKLYNETSGAYVHLDAGSITGLSCSTTTKTLITSSNLNGATNFSTNAAMYSLHLFGTGSLTPTSILYGAEVVTT